MLKMTLLWHIHIACVTSCHSIVVLMLIYIKERAVLMSLKLPSAFSAGLATIRQSIWQNYWHRQEEAAFKAVTLG